MILIATNMAWLRGRLKKISFTNIYGSCPHLALNGVSAAGASVLGRLHFFSPLCCGTQFSNLQTASYHRIPSEARCRPQRACGAHCAAWAWASSPTVSVTKAPRLWPSVPCKWTWLWISPKWLCGALVMCSALLHHVLCV